MPDLSIPPAHAAAFAEGVALFNARQWFEAHEVWEELWRRPEAAGDLKLVYQSLILAAVALEHAHRGNARGALLTADRAEVVAGSVAAAVDLPGCDLGRLLADLRRFFSPLRALGAEAWPPRRRLPELPLDWSGAPRLSTGSRT